MDFAQDAQQLIPQHHAGTAVRMEMFHILIIFLKAQPFRRKAQFAQRFCQDALGREEIAADIDPVQLGTLQ